MIPVLKTTSAVANASGKVTLNFLENPGIGLTWTGKLQVINSTPGANFTCTIGNTTWGNWVGQAPYGPVQARDGEQIQIVGTGLLPGTQVNCQFTGHVDNTHNVDPVIPEGSAQTITQVESVSLLFNQSVTISSLSQGITIPVPPNARRLSIIFAGFANLLNVVSPLVIGGTTGVTYSTLNFVNATSQIFYVAVEPLVDPTITFSLRLSSGANQTGALAIVGSITNPAVDIAQQDVNPVNIAGTITANQGAGNGLPNNIAWKVALADNANPTNFLTIDTALPNDGTTFRRLAVDADRPALKGVYYARTSFTLNATADTFPAGEFMLVNPLASGVNIELRHIAVSFGTTGTTVAATTARHGWSRFTFSGGSSSSTLAAKRATADPNPLGLALTTLTGLTGTARANDIFQIETPGLVTASAMYGTGPAQHIWLPDDRPVLAPGEGLILIQDTAGVTSEARAMAFAVCWGEY